MRYTELGSSGIEVSRVAMGLQNLSGGSVWGDHSEEKALETIDAAFDAGITFFDLAEGYGDGRAEELLGTALENRDRSDAVVATKVSPGNLEAEDLKAACERSLDRLNTDFIDVYYIHWPNRDVPFEETLTAMQELKDDGKVEVLACSNFGRRDLEETLDHGRVEANQLPYNLLWRAIEFEIRDVCAENDVGITTYSSIAQGLLTGKFESPDEVPDGRARTRHFSGDRPNTSHGEAGAEELTFKTIDRIREICADADVEMVNAALAWNLAQPGIDSVVAGAKNPEQVRANARAADVDLSQDVIDRLTDATEELKRTLGPNPDMWLPGSRIRRTE